MLRKSSSCRRLMLAASVALAAMGTLGAAEAARSAAGIGKGVQAPLCIAVLDFSTVEDSAQRQFLSERSRPIDIPASCTLSNADRLSINRVMQGWIRMIDARDTSAASEANLQTQLEDNRFNREKALALYNASVSGETRPVVIGAEYLTAMLGKHNDVFRIVDPATVTAAMDRLSREADFPTDPAVRLVRETGVTHLVYGTVSDPRRREVVFRGYGIETKNTEYKLDVIIRVVDLTGEKPSFGNVYTGTFLDRQPVSGSQLDDGIFQELMNSALLQAAEEIYGQFRPGASPASGNTEE